MRPGFGEVPSVDRVYITPDMRAVQILRTVVAAFALLSVNCPAQLSFRQPSVDLKLPIDSQEGVAEFPFVNVGGTVVRVLRIDTECECIQASPTAGSIEGGGTGKITLRFRTRKRNGIENIRANIVTDIGSYPIVAAASVSSYIEITPNVLRWGSAETRDAKECIVTASGLGHFIITKVTALNGTRVEVFPLDDLPSHRLRVKVPVEDAVFSDTILISAVLAGTGETKLYDLQVRAE